MTDDELNSQTALALAAFRDGRFEDEAKIWETLCAAVPEKYEYLSNLASAHANMGNCEKALELFETVIEKNPSLSRAHNNRAALLARLGVDAQTLLPAFSIALETSGDHGEFIRHLLNVCQSAAFGPDHGGEELVSEIEGIAEAILDSRCPEDDLLTMKSHCRGIVSGYRHLSKFRTALSNRHWAAAAASASDARSAFLSSKLDFVAESTAHTVRYLETGQRIFGLLEKIASGTISDAAQAQSAASDLHEQASDLRVKYPDSMLSRFLDVSGWFLYLFLHQLSYLSSPSVQYQHVEDDLQLMIWLSSSSFRRLGDELISIINFAERLCVQTAATLQNAASAELIQHVKADAWDKLTLSINARVFDFTGVDMELAQKALQRRKSAVERVREELLDFRSFVERQAYKDIFVDSRPQENIARALLQARLRGRSYREVPVRGGRTDVLAFVSGEGKRVVIETKIWRGSEYHEQGLRELSEYIEGENDDRNLLGAFYVVFDATESAKAIAHEGSAISTRTVKEVEVAVLIISLCPPTPSRARMSSHQGSS